MNSFLKSLKSAFIALVRLPIVSRSLHTFWQGFLATFLVGIPLVVAVAQAQGIDEGQRAVISLIVASFMAGLSILKTSLLLANKH